MQEKQIMSYREMRSRHPVVSRILLLGILVNLLCLMARLGSIPREYNQAADLWCIYSFLTICYCGLSCYIMYRMCRGKKIMPFFILSFPVFFLFSGILLPSERSAMSFAEQLSCQEHMLTIRLACLAYAEDHDGNYPSSLELLWNRDNSYLEYKVLHCPRYQGQRPGQCDYLYYGAGLVQGKEPEHYLFLEDKPGNHLQERRFSKFYFMGNNDYCFNSSDLK